MAGLAIPGGPEALTPDWVTRALRETGTIRNATVTSFDTTPIGEGTGLLGQLARVSLRYDQAEEGAPQALVAKFPAAEPENRETGKLFRFYERENRFYEELAGKIELRTPRCYYSAVDPQTQNFVLLLEDLAPARVGDQLAGCTVAEADLCIRELAKFHATWWESPRLAGLDWMPFTNDPPMAESVQENYQEAWEPFLEFAGDRLPAAVREVGERFGESVITMMDRFGAPPRTIIHGDYRLDNLFFATPEGGDPLAVIDWQISSRGRGVFDVAYFTAGTLPPADRKREEMNLLRKYHQVLVEHGVRGYDFDQCVEDYRASILFCLIYSVVAIPNVDLTNERGVELFTTIMERTVSAIDDLNAGELLPD